MSVLLEDGTIMNFMEEIYKENTNMEIEMSQTQENDFCLISNNLLNETAVQLKCGHKFNYVPLYKDIVNHKKKFIQLESQYYLKSEIRCPYCRTKQNGLLPYYDLPGVIKIEGVNHNESCSINQDTYVLGLCQFITNCPYKFVVALEEGYKTCYFHKKKMIKLIENENKKKIKNAKKQEKINLLKSMKEKKQNDEKIDGCVQILKTGKHIGEKCNILKLFEKTCYCARHYKMSVKEDEVKNKEKET